MTMKEYPPAQTAGSWNINKIMEQLKEGVGSN
jgi:hypothetical protein